VRLEDLNWFDVQGYLEQDDRLMLVLGACEQHAYLSLLTDVRIPLALGDAASQKSGVLLAPPLNFGASPYFLDYPGTISLRVSTLNAVVGDLVDSVYRHGFRKLLFLNGHGGNQGVRELLSEKANQLAGLRISWYAWFDSHSVQAILEKHEIKGYHASWFEAFPFNQVGELPDRSKTPPYVPGLLSAAQAREVYGDGSLGGDYRPDPALLDEIFLAAVADILQLLRFEEESGPSREGS